MIEDLLTTVTPYIINGKKLYDEEDVRKIIVKTIQYGSVKNSKFDMYSGGRVEQYPEATC